MSISIDLTPDQIKKIAACIMAEWADLNIKPEKIRKDENEVVKPYVEPTKPRRGKRGGYRQTLKTLAEDMEIILATQETPMKIFEVGKALQAFKRDEYKKMASSTIHNYLEKLVMNDKAKYAGKIGNAKLYQIINSNKPR